MRLRLCHWIKPQKLDSIVAQTPSNLITYLLKLLLPVLLPLVHHFHTVGKGSDDPGSCRLERDRLTTEVNAAQVRWRVGSTASSHGKVGMRVRSVVVVVWSGMNCGFECKGITACASMTFWGVPRWKGGMVAGRPAVGGACEG